MSSIPDTKKVGIADIEARILILSAVFLTGVIFTLIIISPPFVPPEL